MSELLPFLLFLVGVWFSAFMGAYLGRVTADDVLTRNKDKGDGPS